MKNNYYDPETNKVYSGVNNYDFKIQVYLDLNLGLTLYGDEAVDYAISLKNQIFLLKI